MTKFLAALAESPSRVAFGDRTALSAVRCRRPGSAGSTCLPAEQYEFGGEAGAHGDHQPQGAWRWRVGHGVLKNIEHRNRRQISVVAQRLSSDIERIRWHVEHIFDRVDYLRARRREGPIVRYRRWSGQSRRGSCGCHHQGISRRPRQFRRTGRSGIPRCRSSSPARPRCPGRCGCGSRATFGSDLPAASAPVAMTAAAPSPNRLVRDQVCDRMVVALNGQRA